MQTARDKALLCNTLIGILKACEGKRVQVDLRNEIHVFGKIESVYGDMNLIMSNAYLTIPFENKQTSSKYNEITIRGCNIRFVHVPDDIDMINALQNQILTVRRSLRPPQKFTNKTKRSASNTQNTQNNQNKNK